MFDDSPSFVGALSENGQCEMESRPAVRQHRADGRGADASAGCEGQKPCLSVISSAIATKSLLRRPSLQGRATTADGESVSERSLPSPSPVPPLAPLPSGVSGDSNNRKLANNENNMQSVNLSVRKESASDRARQKRRGEEAPGRAVERFADGLPTLASLRRGCGRPAPRLRLCGGGESSLGNATGWGSPPSSSNGNAGSWGNVGQGGSGNGPNPPQQWGNNLQRPPVSQADVNSNKSLGSQNSIPSSSGASGVSPGTPASPNAGWQSQTPPQNNSNLPLNGSSNSTQGGGAGGGAGGDGSPGGNASGNGSPGGNASSNGSLAPNSAKNQLEQLSSMRETLFSQDGWGGQHVNQDTDWDVPGSPEPGVKPDQPGAPPLWKPNVNNGTDLWEANLRNGGQPPPPQTPKTPWGHTPATNIGGTWGEDDEPADAANVWNGPPPPQHQWGGAPPQPHPHSHWPKKDDWGAWGEAERDPRRLDPRAPDPHERDPRDPRFARPPDPRDLKDPRDLRGDPRGISGRLNGAPAGDAWPHRAPPPAKLPHGKPGGWEEPSPPAQRRAPPFDEGGWQRGPQRPPHAPPGRPPGPLKPEAPWPHAPRNGSWDEGPAPAAHGWDKEGAAWAEAGWGAPPKPKPWDAEAPGDWAKPGPPAKLLPKDAVWNSKQFQLLVGMGYKKEEAEEALRSRNMNAEEAAELLSQMRGGGAMDAWRRHDDHAPFERPQYPPQRPHHFQPPAGPYQSGAAPAPHKMLGQPAAQPPPPSPFAQPNSQSGAQPCTSQLRQLVQQIQMAVSNGYLNHQILNQPLAPPTLVLLNQLLQQIKSLHQLVQQQNMVQNSLGNGKSNSTAVLHISVQITKTKQQIQNLQNQITAQQALYLKQQGGAGGSSASDFFKQPHDPLQQLQNNFADIGLGKEPQTGYGGGGGGQQSRLNQWKLPAPDKEAEEFSRAPGSVAKSAASPPGPGGDAWGGGRPHGEAAWGGEADAPDGKEAPAWPSAAQAAYSDLVPEFEPGKPWKMKMVEDDPAITPGSVAVRSPLGLGAGKEEGEAAPAPERSLSSSTWSYAPFKPKGWEGEWGKRGPGGPGPPKPWHGAPPTAQRPHHQQPQPPPAAWHSSTWLLLKNLTAQIDGSTLKTLCMQHGPLQSFHLYLTQGIALARYSTREEANKAQTALNNCVLGNTTIFAEAPGDSDVSMILQHLGQGGGGGWRREGRDGRDGREPGPKPPLGPDQPWPFGSLWADEQRATPSSLNSFLPPDLLGGESV